MMTEQAIQSPLQRTPPRTYVALEHVEKFLAFGRREGIPVDALLAQHHIDLRRDTNKPGYVPGHIWEVMLDIGIQWCERLGDPLAGLRIAQGLGTGFTGLWAYVMETSGTFLQAIDSAVTYQKLHTTAVTATVRRVPGYLDIIIAPQFEKASVCRHTADWYLAMLALLAQHSCDNVAELVDSVSMRHSAPADAALLQRYHDLFNCSIRFDAPDNVIRLHARGLNRSLVTADPALQSALEQQARVKLAAYDDSSLNTLTEMRRALRQLLAEGQASKDQLAASMCMSPRTLQRKLQAQGSSYQQLLREVRLSEARAYLRDSLLPMSTISLRLGFRDPQSFSRWFADLTGEAPSRYREQRVTT